jgi:hypothetical protein
MHNDKGEGCTLYVEHPLPPPALELGGNIDRCYGEENLEKEEDKMGESEKEKGRKSVDKGKIKVKRVKQI